MNKIIITHSTDVSPKEALDHVALVIDGGRVSVSRGIHHYCWVTTWYSGVRVHVRPKNNEDSADSFHVHRLAGVALKKIIQAGGFNQHSLT